MGIRFNVSCGCCSVGEFPAWTVYHSNVSEKLHYYIASVSQLCGDGGNSIVYLFYETTSGGYLVYKNCPYFRITGGGGSTSETSLTDTYRIYLEQTNIAPTGASIENTWVKAARIAKVEISGVFFGGPYPTFQSSYNTVLTYDSGKSQYTMGMHYCGCSGFSGCLVGSGTIVSGFSVFPAVAGKISTDRTNPISQITVNSDIFNEYTYTNTNNPSFEYRFTPDRSAGVAFSSGTIYHSSGINSASKTLIWENSGCTTLPPCLYDAHQYEYTFDVTNYTSGTYFVLSTFKQPIEIVNSFNSQLICVPAYARNDSLIRYANFFDNYSSLITYTDVSYYIFDGTPNSLNNGGNFNTYGIRYGESFVGYSPGYLVNYGFGVIRCTDTSLLDGAVLSGIYFCVSGNSPSGYTYRNYTTTLSGASNSGLLVPYSPILAAIKVIKINHSQNIIGQFLYDDGAYTTCLGPYDPTGVILGTNFWYPEGPVASNITNYNYNISVGILDNFSSKHVLEDFSSTGDFINQTLSPWFGAVSTAGYYTNVNSCPPTGSGIFSNTYGVSGSGSGYTYTYGCPLGGGPGPFTATYSLPKNCETYYNVTTSALDFTNLQLIIPSSELCL